MEMVTCEKHTIGDGKNNQGEQKWVLKILKIWELRN